MPYVFQEGGIMRADEISENFRHLDSEIGTLSDDVESAVNSAGPDENYTYNQTHLPVGCYKLTTESSNAAIKDLKKYAGSYRNRTTLACVLTYIR